MTPTIIIRLLVTIFLFTASLSVNAQAEASTKKDQSISGDSLMVRIAELEIHPQFLTAYLEILKREAAASIQKEPGVISIFPMSEKSRPTSIRIIEIYASRNAYQAHLQSPHFLHYKKETASMVKSLKLVEMDPLDLTMMKEIFTKL